MDDKKNTDCVYFLASPLTCKKGMQCEFRHSEVARLNPRDCWYWLSGNCLNFDCPFRHPPLDAEEEDNSSSNPRVPCFFFSQGYCAKGDQCPFMHGFARRSSQQVQTQQQQQQQSQSQSQQRSTTTSLPQAASAPAAAQTISNGNSKLASGAIGQRSLPAAEPPQHVHLVTPEEHEQQRHQLESSSCPTEDEDADGEEELQERSEYSGEEHQDWAMPMRGSDSPDLEDVDPGTQQDFYSDDGDNYDTVLDPVNASSQFEQHHPLESAYDFVPGCRYDHNSLQNGGGGAARIRDSFAEYKPYDPPYQPSIPYDCMINSRQPGLVQEQRIDHLDALLGNLDGINRGRLEDRLVFPRGNHRNLFAANRLRLLNGASSVHNRVVYEEKNPSIRLERPGLWRVANGNSRSSVHSRLGRPSVKTRLKYVANNRRHHLHHHQQQQNLQQHQHQQNHHHRQQQQQQRYHGRNARYLGVMQQQHWRHHHKVAKKSKLTATAAAAAVAAAPAAGNAARSNIKVRESQFDGPKTLAELKAAKS